MNILCAMLTIFKCQAEVSLQREQRPLCGPEAVRGRQAASEPRAVRGASIRVCSLEPRMRQTRGIILEDEDGGESEVLPV